MVFSFKITNTAFGTSDIYTLLDSNRNCLKVMIMNSNSQGTWQQIELIDKNGKDKADSFEIQLNDNNDILVSCKFESTLFEAQDFKTYPLYATYVVIYSNENLPIEPYPHNYMFTGTDFRIIEQEDLTDKAIQKADAVLNKWITQDSVKITNTHTDEHKHFIIGKDRKIYSENDDAKKDNVLLTKDNDSEEITFKIPRFYDGIDLNTKNLRIYYIRPAAKDTDEIPQGISENLSVENFDENYITATWVVTKIATSMAGILSYAIIAEGDVIEDEYFWQSYPSQFIVDKGIYGSLPYQENDFSFIEKSSFKTDITETVEELNSSYQSGEIKWQSLETLKNLLTVE